MALVPGAEEKIIENECSRESSDGTDSANVNSVALVENRKTDNGTINLFNNRTVNICSPFSTRDSHRPVFGSNRSILKPSALFTDANISSPSVTFGSNASKSVKLKPSVLSNPFMISSSEKTNDFKSNCDEKTDVLPISERTDSTGEDSSCASRSLAPALVSPSSASGISAPVFVPLNDPASSTSSSVSPVSSAISNSTSSTISTAQSATESTNNTPSSATAASAFVFGQNLRERVASVNENAQEPINQNGVSFSEMLFSSAIKQDKQKESGASHEFSNGNTKTLSASAKEYEEARSVKRKYEEVAVITGEEDEQNILQINCKLFAFDNTLSTWTERGRGTLRVNDKETADGRSSRLVMRLLGNLRVVLNTKVWSDMNVELASKKSVRLTAIDNDGQVRIYLVTANPKDSEQLYNVLTTRIQKKKMKTSSEESSSKASKFV